MPELVEARPQIARRRESRRLARGDHDIDAGKDVLIHAKRLAREAFDPIACNRAAEGPGGDSQPQTRVRFMIGQD